MDFQLPESWDDTCTFMGIITCTIHVLKTLYQTIRSINGVVDDAPWDTISYIKHHQHFVVLISSFNQGGVPPWLFRAYRSERNVNAFYSITVGL